MNNTYNNLTEYEKDTYKKAKNTYNKAIDDFSKMCLKYKSKDNIIYFNEATLYMIAEKLKGSR